MFSVLEFGSSDYGLTRGGLRELPLSLSWATEREIQSPCHLGGVHGRRGGAARRHGADTGHPRPAAGWAAAAGQSSAHRGYHPEYIGLIWSLVRCKMGSRTSGLRIMFRGCSQVP
jgi:hypothetical protein